MKLEPFVKEVVAELNASPLGGKYLFKDQGNGEVWVGKWGNHGISMTEFFATIIRNPTHKDKP